MNTDYLVIGGGIVGLATARRLQDKFPDAAVAVLDKEGRVAAHQSGHNSGVIHAGVYYAPGSMKARLCRAGIRRTMEFCEKNAVEYRRCGKLIVATTDAESQRLAGLGDRAAQNGCHSEYLDAIAIRDLEPNVTGVAALKIGDTGIADYPALCRTLAILIKDGGGTLSLNTRVESIDERTNEVRIESNHGPFTAKYLIVCCGLQADRLARIAGLEIDFAIVPFRGDYYRLSGERSNLVSTLIYPVPDPRLPFLGVHLTLTIDGSITVGPTAMLAFEREAYCRWALDIRDAAAVAACFQDVRDRRGRIDAVVNNSGRHSQVLNHYFGSWDEVSGATLQYNPEYTSEFLEIPDEAWHDDFDLMVMNCIRMARAVSPHLLKRSHLF